MSGSLVIIPTFNERDNIHAILDAVLSLSENFHVLIIDDGSPDGTADLVRDKQVAYSDRLFLECRTGKLGLGTAYIHGFKWALARDYAHIFEMDADFSHDPKDLPRLLEACTLQGADMAIGSRYSNGVNVVNWPMSRVLLSYFASKYVRFITGMPIHDTTAGFICYRRSVLEALDFEKIRFVGYAFQIEMKFRAWQKNFQLAEVPVIFTDRKLGQSKMSSGIIREAVFGVILLKITSIFRK
ncbi:MAG TPA: dolichyl-phosphate beta-D-mannosyltransferase [Cryomorphaceae bacterium]|jgi:dolichol-phosphate mannosyltransferase|nr:MAG: dolichyl-phosphate beta-D-mannosyltransferase [Cryomorphaceae bacterium BACL7 MAG-120910-bin2]KRO69240.1 MAG: dolichyl-phosphate beta-D-mannosyltransferase [Cryomorphaceae bacterium BACL7 MAG-120322-bin74]KRO82300.1 MAG: dolichyl-phosphate beta-D-mannosyltransferase [Cryomorphaceae bacterium BACL7 MAG-121220-bin83]NQW24902.1 polyprenol monophosphomannose synthase [Cryomorphaceae bacterium]HAB31592.1 dolichyl-phosphate beta-D-mannosyltransferase [Cryomorphaceae bacterium]|tara:strand:+ start:602 stop:1324 length:723 start_codon:yes stop_codon:yes gene_type:complete